MDKPTWDATTLAANSRTAATWRGYAANWRAFQAWCAERGRNALPAAPETVGEYIADQGHRLKPATVDRHLSAILVHHKLQGHSLSRHHPAICEVLRGLRRMVQAEPEGKVPLVVEDIQNLVACLPRRTLAGMRDAAILLFGFATASRRSELAALTIADLMWTSEGVVVRIRRSKEDQEGQGFIKTVPFGSNPDTCPVKTLRAWIMAAGLSEGPVFRRVDRHDRLHADGLSGEAIAEIVRRAVGRMGKTEGWSKRDIEAAMAQTGAHSLRSGYVTSVVQAGATEWQAMLVTGHRSPKMVRRYARPATGFRHSPTRKLGL